MLNRKWPQARPINRLRGGLVRLDSFGIAMEKGDKDFIFIIYAFEFLNHDNSFTFNKPRDLNETIREKLPDDDRLRINSTRLRTTNSRPQEQHDVQEEFYSQDS